MKLKARFLLLATPLLFLLMPSCKVGKQVAKDFAMFQTNMDSLGKVEYKDLKIKQGDNLRIQVYTEASISQNQALIFNLPGGGKGDAGTYTVNSKGNILFPKLGMVKAEGKTLTELTDTLKQGLDKYIKDVGITVTYDVLTVNVLGEVRSPGAKKFATEHFSIIDAIGAAGGLTDDGRRNDVMVIREDSGRRSYYNIDMRSGNLYQSPAFQLQQNDMVYVGPTEMKLKAIKNQNIQQNLQPVLAVTSLTSFALNIAILIISLNNR